MLGIQLSLALYKEHKYHESLKILQSCINNCFGSKGNQTSKMGILIMLNYNYLTLLDKVHEFEHVDSIFQEGMEYCFLTGKCSILPKLIANYVSILEQKGNNNIEKQKKYLQAAMKLLQLYGQNQDKEILCQYYTKKYGD